MKHIQLFEHWSDDYGTPNDKENEDEDLDRDDDLSDDEDDEDEDWEEEHDHEDEEVDDYYDHSNGLRFYSDCVGWSHNEIDVLNHIIDTATEIKRAEFLPHVHAGDMRGLDKDLGYGKNGLTMEKDWHVKYFRSTDLDGKIVYFFVHSAIEYCFMEEPETTEDLSGYEPDEEELDDLMDDEDGDDNTPHPPVPMT